MTGLESANARTLTSSVALDKGQQCDKKVVELAKYGLDSCSAVDMSHSCPEKMAALAASGWGFHTEIDASRCPGKGVELAVYDWGVVVDLHAVVRPQ